MLSITVYRGTSVNINNGVDPYLPTFGRFAPRVDVQQCRVARDEEAEGDQYYIVLPYGGTFGMYATEAEAEKALTTLGNLRRDGWQTDRQIAEEYAIEHARARHEQHCRESEHYAEKWNI